MKRKNDVFRHGIFYFHFSFDKDYVHAKEIMIGKKRETITSKKERKPNQAKRADQTNTVNVFVLVPLSFET